MSITPLDIYKRTPMTNCGECGHATCLAFAAGVVSQGYDPKKCPYLEDGAVDKLRAALHGKKGPGVDGQKRGLEPKGKQPREKVRDIDFSSVAQPLGAQYSVERGEETLKICFFGRDVLLTKEAARYGDGKNLKGWDEGLLYNYVYHSGKKSLSGKWVGIESFPGSISKQAHLEESCHRKITRVFAGSPEILEKECEGLGGLDLSKGHSADLAFRFDALPKVPLLLLFWDKDEEEGFEATAKVLFDEGGLEYLDLESIYYAAAKLADLLINMKEGKGVT